MAVPFQILKSVLVDVSDHVHSGIDIEDIEEVFDEIMEENQNCVYKAIPNMLVYEIKTLLTKDKDLIKLGDDISNKIELLRKKDNNEKSYIN